MKTKVSFLYSKKHDEVFAYFPDEYYNKELYGFMKTGYSHIGQHSGCCPRYAKGCRKATPEQYASLKQELESIGYELKII